MTRKNYTIVMTRSAGKDMDRLPTEVFRRIDVRILTLADNPFPSGHKKIHGYDHYYRLRVGQYRIVYEVGTEIRIVTVIRVGHRKDVYRFL